MTRDRSITCAARVATLSVVLLVAAMPFHACADGAPLPEAPAPDATPSGTTAAECPAPASATAAACAAPAGSCVPTSSISACSSSCAKAPLVRVDPAAAVGARTGPSPLDLGLVDLDPILEPVRAFYRVPAMTVALVRDGELAAIGAVGTRMAGSRRPVELDDKWHLGSCGKAFTATAAAVLVERGTIDWTTTIASVYPELSGEIRGIYEPVTLVQLLRHRSGYPARDERFDETVSHLDGPISQQRAQVVRFASSGEAVARPGATFRYTDVGYTVAGAIMERAAQKSWENLVVELVATPLGLSSLGFGAPGTRGELDQPRGHVLIDGELVAQGVGPGADLANPVIGPAGTVHASITDWARFAGVHLAGARGTPRELLSASTFAMLHTDYEGQGYALGWGVTTNPWGQGRALVHSGSCGAWAALIWVLPEANEAIVAAANYGGAFDALSDAVDRVMQGVAAPTAR